MQGQEQNTKPETVEVSPVATTPEVKPSSDAPAPGQASDTPGLGIDFNQSLGIDLPTEDSSIPGDPELTNHVAGVASTAAGGVITKPEFSGEITSNGTNAVRGQFTSAQQMARYDAHVSAADKAAAQGDAAKTAHHIGQATSAKDNPNPGAMEQYAIQNISQDPVEKELQERQWRTQALVNILKELQDKQAKQSTGQKIVEFASSLFPMHYSMAASAVGKDGRVNSLYDALTPGSFVGEQYNRLMGLSHEEFTQELTRIQKGLGEKSGGILGDEGIATQIEVLQNLLQGTSQDSNLYTVSAIADAGAIATSVAKVAVKGTKAIAKATGVIGKGRNDTKVIAKTVNEDNVQTGSLINVGKDLKQQKLVANKVSDAVESGNSNEIVPSANAAAKNAAPYNEPMYSVDGTASKVQNISEFKNGIGVGDKGLLQKIQEGLEDGNTARNRLLAEAAETIRQTQLNRGFTELELASAEAAQIQKLADTSLSFNAQTIHYITDDTLEARMKATIYQEDGMGWDTEALAKDYAFKVFKEPERFSVMQDVSGKFALVRDDALNDLATITNVELKEASYVTKIFNGIFHDKMGNLAGRIPFGVANPAGFLPEGVQASAQTALALDRKLLEVHNGIYALNLDKLTINQKKQMVQVAEYVRNLDSHEWPTSDEMVKIWHEVTGEAPTVTQMKAWDDGKVLNDIDWTVKNIRKRNELLASGHVQLNVPTENIELQSVLAKPITSEFKIKDAAYFYNADTNEWQALSKVEFDNLANEGYRFYNIRDEAHTLFQGKRTRIKYLMSKKASEDMVPMDVLPYRANGRVDYAGDIFVKQPNPQNVNINGEMKVINHSPITHAISEKASDAKRFANELNAAIRATKEFQTIVKPSVEDMNKVKNLWAKTRWQTVDRFMADVEAGKATMEEVEVVFNRRGLKKGEEYLKEASRRLGSDDNLDTFFNIERRGERKLDPNGQPARLKSPYLTLDSSFSKDSKKLAFQNFVNDAATRWVKTFGKHLKTDDVFADSLTTVVHGEFDVNAPTIYKAMGRRYQSWLKGLINVGFTTSNRDLDEMMGQMAKLEEALESGNVVTKAYAWSRLGIMKNWQWSSPANFFRGLMFRSTFGFYNLAQLPMQMTTGILNMGMMALTDPVLAAKALRDSTLLSYGLASGMQKGFKYLDKIAKDGKHDVSSVAEMVRDWHDSGFGLLQRDFGQNTRLTHHDYMLDKSNKVSPYLAEAGNKVKKQLDYSNAPFTAGTTAGNLPAFTATRLKLLKKYGELAQKDGTITRAKYLKALREETERLTLGQSSANKLLIQNASKDSPFVGTFVELMTQWTQYNWKYTTALLPTSIGGSKSFSTAEKWALGITGATLSGSSFVPFGNYFSAQMFTYFKTNGWYDGSPEDWRTSFWNKGLVDTVLSKVFKTETSVGSILAPWGPIEDLLGVVSGQTPLNMYVGGPLANKMTQFFNNYYRAQSLQDALNGKKDTPMSTKGIGILLSALEEATIGTISSASRYAKLIDALKNPLVVTKNGYAIARSNDTAAWLNFLGINSSPYDALEFQQTIIDHFEAKKDQDIKLYRILLDKREEAIQNQDYDTAEQVDNALASYMGFLPPQQRASLIRSANKNHQTPAIEANKRKVDEFFDQQTLIEYQKGMGE